MSENGKTSNTPAWTEKKYKPYHKSVYVVWDKPKFIRSTFSILFRFVIISNGGMLYNWTKDTGQTFVHIRIWRKVLFLTKNDVGPFHMLQFQEIHQIHILSLVIYPLIQSCLYYVLDCSLSSPMFLKSDWHEAICTEFIKYIEKK